MKAVGAPTALSAVEKENLLPGTRDWLLDLTRIDPATNKPKLPDSFKDAQEQCSMRIDRP